jgi:small GTP-binding protein
MSKISKKICLVGDFGVGKTSLIRRFIDREFSDKYLSTIGVKVSRKDVDLNLGDKNVALQLLIWDLEGSTKYKAIAPSYLQGSTGIIIVADVTRPETIEHLQDHIKLFLSVNPKGLIICAFNKSDLIEAEKLQKLMSGFNQEKVMKIYATSAKMGDNVDEIFHTLGAAIIYK